MRHLRRIQSESSLQPHSTLEVRPKDWIRSGSKQHQARPHFSASTAPAKLECCEALANQNNEQQNLLHEQEEQIQTLQDTVRKLIDKTNLLTSKLSDRMKESISLELKAASLDRDLETVLNDQRNISHTINELQVKVSKLSLLPEVTPRVIVVIKMLEMLNQASQPLSGKGTCTSLISLDNRRGTNLRSALDTLLSTDEAQILFSTFDKWFSTKALQSIALVTCFVCRKAKFRQTAAIDGATLVNEFTTTGLAISCDKAVCSVCYLKSVSYSLELLQETWWTAQGSTISILCPCRNHCDSIPMDDRQKLIKLLQMTNDDWLKIRKMKIYDTALYLMKILNKIEPKLTTSARQVAARMHRKMMANGFMHYPFDMGYWDLYHTETGSPLQANSKFIQVYNVEHGGKTLSIPVFTRFLRAEKEPADCAICAESICDVSYGSIEEWTKVCAEFNGNWMWRVLLFPQKLSTQCNHTIDFCTPCLQRHIGAQLEQFGRSACDNITCPSASCERLLTYEELQIYAQEDTFSRYDEYLKLKALSQMPSFLWCLSEKCSSGQIHDLLLNSHVVCADCEFEMCFTHQVKWHEGLLCEQFDSLKETRDPEFQQTQEWIKTNTKPCPECDIQVQKGSGCFHMTCSLCDHEFCWECLASWRDIRPGSGVYNRSAHNDGCYFKTSDQEPTEVAGTSITATA